MNMYTQNYDRPPASQLSMASLILVVISILFLCCGTSFFFAAPGIVLALLSRGNREMDSMARAGLLFSVLGLILSLIAVIAILFMSFDPDSMQEIQLLASIR